MAEFAVYITDHSDFGSDEGFYVFDADNIDDALADAKATVEIVAANWGPRLLVEFAIPSSAARLAVNGSGPVELRPCIELASYRTPHR